VPSSRAAHLTGDFMISNEQKLRIKETIEIYGSPEWKDVLLEWIKNHCKDRDPKKVLEYLTEEGWIETTNDGRVKWIKPLNQDKDLYILHLEEELKHKKRCITDLLDTVNRFAKRLDAMWWVWCDGHCKSGVSRYHEADLTKEVVEIAEHNAIRLRKKFGKFEESLFLKELEWRVKWTSFMWKPPKKEISSGQTAQVNMPSEKTENQ